MTTLKPEIDSLDGLDKAHHVLYTEREGKYVFTGLEGYDPSQPGKLQKALDTERENAKKYANEVKTLKPWKIFGEKKPEEIQAQLDRIEELEAAAAGKLDKTELEKMATARAEAATKPLQRQLSAAAEAQKELNEQLAAAQARVTAYERAEERAAIRAAIQAAALASNALPEAYADGGGLLAVLEGALEVDVQVDSEGKRTLGAVRSKDGAGYPSGLDVAKLLQQVQSKQGYFWGTSKGGGANPGNGGPRLAGGTNPFKAESRNRSAMMRVWKENRALAKQQMAAAGVTPSQVGFTED
jgi:hypothetical protein